MTIDWGINMQLFKSVLTTLGLAAMSVAISLPQVANAGDRRVVVGTRHMTVTRHVPQTVITRYPNTVVYSRTPRVIYQGAPTVVIATPFINNGFNTRPFISQRGWNRGWRNGWGNRNFRNGSGRYCAPNRRSSAGYYRGQGRRW